MRTLLDLGIQKTGSKARQRFFLDHLHRVNGAHPLFPGSGRLGSWHRPLYESLATGDRSMLDALSREVSEKGGSIDLLILSYEEMHKLSQPRIALLNDALPDVTALLFLRRQDQLVNSLHNQFHKSHRVPLRELEWFESGMLAYDTACDYRVTLDRWASVLGRKAVVPILFTKSESSVASFFAHGRVSVDLAGYDEIYPNRAMDAEGLAILRWIKRLVVDEEELPAVMSHAHRVLAPHFVPSHDDVGYTLTMEQRQRLMSQYEASNEWVRREFFPERTSLFEPLEQGHVVRPDFASGRETAEAIIALARAADR